MHNTTIEIDDELIERRLMVELSQNDVLPYQELKTRAAANAYDHTVRRVLREMIEQGLVQLKPDRKGVWYLGYARSQSADKRSNLDDVPAPFANLLRQLAW
jgi:hypothetical protein